MIISLKKFFFPLLLFGFLVLPKISLGPLSFYVSDVAIIIYFIALSIKNNGVFNFDSKMFYPFQLLFLWLSFNIIIVLLSLISNQSLNTLEPLILISKSFLYFYFLVLICSHTDYPNFVFANLKRIFLIFFITSCILTTWKAINSSTALSVLLWNNYELGARFVGFTGFALSSEGIVNLGSTSNSVGMLYLLFMSVFLYGSKEIRSIFLGALSFAGAILSFSQAAVLGVSLLLIFQIFRQKIPIYVLIIFSLAILFPFITFTYFPEIFNNIGISRIFDSINKLIITGEIPGTLGDRFKQMSHIFGSFVTFPESLLLGQPFFWKDGLEDTIGA